MHQRIRSLFCISLVVALSAIPKAFAQEANGVFGFHVPSEPTSLDPAKLTSTDANYLFHNVYRGLYLFRASDGLKPDGAESCVLQNSKKLVCKLNPKSKWSDGTVVTAEDYVRAFRHLVAPESKNLGVEMLQYVRNANDVYTGKKPVNELGVRAMGADRLEILFSEPDDEILYKLASPLLVPIKSEAFPDRAAAAKNISNGPYKIESWDVGKRIRLTTNPHYPFGNPTRPPVEIYIVDEEQTALNLYEKGRLAFLRRLPTNLIAKFKTRPDFKQIPQARFDYIGFGPELKDEPELRRALSLSLDFEELRRIYDALGIPGCPGIAETLMKDVPCLRLDAAKAKEAWDKVPAGRRTKRMTLAFSKLGGDENKKGAEWFQHQWAKNLGAKIDLEQTEQGLFLERLRSKPPAIFRKGVGLDRPTCLAALETFAPGGAENFLRLDLPELNTAIRQLKSAKSKASAQRACSDGVQALIAKYWLIPLGRIHFTVLIRPEFDGWDLNEMNQLDLSALRISAKPKK